MAHAFDNRNFVPNKQQTSFTVHSPVLSRYDIKSDLRERSPSPQLLSRVNYPPPSYDDMNSNETFLNRQNSNSSLFHSAAILNDSSYRQNQQQPRTVTNLDHYLQYSPTNGNNNETKPPPPARIPRISSTTNNNYVRRSNILSQYTPNGIKTNKTYLNTTQLYISQPSNENPPPPPPPRYPLHPPAIPPRNPLTSHQKNLIIIPDFNSSSSPKTIYRSPVDSPSSLTIERNDSNYHHFDEHQFNSLSIDNNNNHHHHDQIPETTNGSTVGEYFGNCRKCGETITSLDDPCDILGQIYHGSCAVCIICGQSVKNKHFFIKDQLYCEEDFLNTGIHQTHEYCIACNRLITDTIIQALGESYHLTCFTCSKCLMCLDGKPFIRDKNRNLFCLYDYHMTYGPQCDICSKPICPEDGSNETVRIISMDKTFHIKCYQCEDCSMQLGDEQDRRCYPLDDSLLCQGCCRRRLFTVNKF